MIGIEKVDTKRVKIVETPILPHKDKEKEDDAIRRAQKGDDDAFTYLVQQYYGAILNFLYRLSGGDYGYAEDLAQETFLRCHHYMKKYRFKYAFSTWLFTIATNIYKKQWHKHKTVELGMGDIDSGKNDMKQEMSPLVLAEQKEGAQRLLLSIHTLPREQAVALVLREYEQMSYQEVADVLRTNVNTIKSWVLRAKQALCEKLSKGGL